MHHVLMHFILIHFLKRNLESMTILHPLYGTCIANRFSLKLKKANKNFTKTRPPVNGPLPLGTEGQDNNAPRVILTGVLLQVISTWGTSPPENHQK